MGSPSMKKIPLTRRQQEIYDYLLSRDETEPLTIEALCLAMGVKSRGSMHKHLQALVSGGLVAPMQGKQRGIQVLPPLEPVDQELPFLGRIAAGQPMEALEIPESVTVPDYLRTSRECYVLQVKGDSMIEAGILDGDWVVIEKSSHANNGDIVVALIDNDDVTLKRIEQRRDRVILYPANSSMQPMIFPHSHVQIQGVLVGQMRRYY